MKLRSEGNPIDGAKKNFLGRYHCNKNWFDAPKKPIFTFLVFSSNWRLRLLALGSGCCIIYIRYCVTAVGAEKAACFVFASNPITLDRLRLAGYSM